MKNIFKMIKIGDIVIITMLILLSFLPLAIFTQKENAGAASGEPAEEHLFVTVSVNGEHVHEMELKKDHRREIYEHEDSQGRRNVITREGEKVFISEANCSDSLCVLQGEITEAGETIVCLPHKVLVEITSSSSTIDNDLDVISQ